MRKAIRRLVLLAAVIGALAAMQGAALAGPPDGPVGPGDGGAFLCPAVGAGVANADAHNGDHGVTNVGQLPVAGDYTFLPGNNQAGAHANANGHNTLGPGQTPGPGNGNSDWSPIWPAPPAG